MSSASLQSRREPKYYLVKRHLIDSIKPLQPGTAVPTERMLSAHLGTSRATVRQAVQELVAEGRPMAVETSHLPARRFPRLVAQLRRAESLYAVLKEVYKVVAASAEESISTAPASPREAELLNTDTGAPMLVLGRHTFDADGEPIDWVSSWYRGDRVTFLAQLLPRR